MDYSEVFEEKEQSIRLEQPKFRDEYIQTGEGKAKEQCRNRKSLKLALSKKKGGGNSKDVMGVA